MASLVPPSIRDARSAAFEALLGRLDSLRAVPLWDLDHCPAQALPALAEQLSVQGMDGWALAQTEAQQRDLLKTALLAHARKGTPWALRQVFAACGWPGATIEERVGAHGAWHDATWRRDKRLRYDPAWRSWATFRVRFDLGSRGLGLADQTRLLAAVECWRPVGRHCLGLGFRLAAGPTAVPIQSCTYDALSPRDASLFRGGARLEDACTVQVLTQDGTLLQERPLGGWASRTWLGRTVEFALAGGLVGARVFRLLGRTGTVLAAYTHAAPITTDTHSLLTVHWAVQGATWRTTP